MIDGTGLKSGETGHELRHQFGRSLRISFAEPDQFGWAETTARATAPIIGL